MRHLILYHTAHSLSNYFAQIFLVSSGFSACRRRGLPRPIAVPRPSPRGPLHPKFHLAFGVAESPQGDSLYASPAGPYFSMKKSNQKSLGEDPETPYASEPSRPETLRIPGAGLDDADKEPQAHFNLVPANRLQEVTLPKNLRVIPADMFYGCSALEKVVLPEQLERIEASAFAYCEALTEIDLPEGVQFLGRNAFERCGFVNIRIPDSVTEIEGNPFKNCKALRTVELLPNHPLLTVQEGMLIDHVHQRVLRRLTTDAVCIVPEGIKEIADGAFGRIPELTEITLPDSLKRIGEAAFIYCGMREITIPKGAAEIERAAFLHCDQLETVHLQEGLRVIGWDAFWECSKLTDIQLPKTLEQIGLRAFEHCTSLKQLTIPASITTLYADFVDDGTELLVERGSPMEEWLQEKGYAYTMVEAE